MNPTIVLVALAALGYFVVTKDDDKDNDDPQRPPGRRHDGRAPPQSPYTAPGPQPPPYTPPPRYAPAPAPAPRPAAAPPSGALVGTAQALLATLSSPDCGAISQATMRFQQQALAEGRGVGPTGADGQYGPSTQRVLSDVLRHPAPASLWGPGGRCHGTRASAPVGPGPTPISADSGPGSARPLLDQLNAMIADSDSKADPNDAVLGYKAAGTFAVSTLGPAIDVQTSGRSKPLTGAAWQANGPLQMVRSTHPWAIIHAFDQGPKSTVADKMQARNILTTQMRDKYVAALAQFASAGRGFMTGLGTDIPSTYRKPMCFDAQPDVQLCAAVATAIAHETDPRTLMTLGQRLLASGYPQAATALMAKASTISGGYIP